MKRKNKLNSNTAAKTPSTLLIPEKDKNVLKKHLKTKQMTGKQYLTFLLQQYKNSVLQNNRKKDEKLKTRYQNSNQNLQRWSILPENNDWRELTHISEVVGVSRTFMFMTLFYLDLENNFSES